MKRLLINFTLLSSPLLLIMVLVNYNEDPANLFTSTEKKMVEIVNQGFFVTNLTNYDERLHQLEFINALNYSPDVIILGSSRTMLINSNHFIDENLINNSVSSACINDIIAIYQIYKENNLQPKKIILGLDPWTFNENEIQVGWKSIGPYYEKFYTPSAPLTNWNSIFKYKELFSLSYFQSGLQEIISPTHKKRDKTPQATHNKLNTTLTKLSDNSLIYNQNYRDASEAEILEKVKKYTANQIYGLKNFNEISNDIWKEFDMLMSEFKKNNIEVSFFLSPYHPKVYDVIEKDYLPVLKTEEKIIAFATKNNIKLYGSFNPFRLNMDSHYFYDGMHLKEKGISKLLLHE